MVANRDVKPASVLGGKNSKLMQGRPEGKRLSIRIVDMSAI
jgi:hypothetical protein